MNIHDNLVRYDAQHDPSRYDLRSRPNVTKPKETESVAPSKDSLEISTDKIKRDALIRLLYTSSYMGDSEIASMVIRLFKYLFVAIAWPPYTVVYTIPKWIFAKGVPALAKLISEGAHLLQKTVEKYLRPIVVSVKIRLQHIQKFVEGSIFKPILNAYKNLVEANLKKTAELSKKIISKLSLAASRLFEGAVRVIEIPRQLTEKLKKLIENATDRVKAPFLKARVTIKIAVKWIENSSSKVLEQVSNYLQPVVPGWVIVPFQQIAIKFDTAQKLAEQATTWLSRLVTSKIANRLTSTVKIFHAVLKRLQSEVLLQLKRFGSFLGKGKRHFFQWVQSRKGELLSSTRELSAKIFAKLFSWLPLVIRNALIKIANHWLTKACIRGSKQLLITGYRQVLKAPKLIKSWTVGQLKQGWAEVKKTVQAIVAIVSRGVSFTSRIINRSVYWTLSIFIMSGIITGWGVQLLANITLKLSRWMRRPRFTN